MNEQEIRETLAGLRAEISQLKLGAEESERLERLIADAEADLEQQRPAEARQGLLDELAVAVDQFEVRHPSFTAMLNRLASSLSAMGI